MRTTFLSTIAALSLTAGCSMTDSSSIESEGNRTHPTEECGCKIEGAGLGKEGIYVRMGGVIATFGEWVPKPGSNNEYIGFTLFVDNAPSVGYVVKAGTKTYPSHVLNFMHPGGAGANAISHVDLCDDCLGGDCGPDSTCQDPDGCPDGDGGGGGGGGGTGTGDGGGDGECDNPDGCGGGDGGPVLL
ncbi:MAG: hypothetical protein H0T89_33790 [Deltaproteobacteria bacterium]|nr:hypothetical protein [Deltaproteobacteria bacterium]MDQ3299536.1 hypothetical protein [Myxococcota bacterium]